MAYLNMLDPTEECPSGFRLYSQNGVRACGRPETSGGSCLSVCFSSYNISYSKVCGRVYMATRKAHLMLSGKILIIINSYYVDGISITHGNPREHIWTYAAGLQENFISVQSNGPPECPCTCATGSTQTVPSFVGSDYTSVSLVVQDIMTMAHSTSIVCGMVSSVEQSKGHKFTTVETLSLLWRTSEYNSLVSNKMSTKRCILWACGSVARVGMTRKQDDSSNQCISVYTAIIHPVEKQQGCNC